MNSIQRLSIVCSASGTSITLMTRNDWRQASHLIDIMTEADQVNYTCYASTTSLSSVICDSVYMNLYCVHNLCNTF